MGKTRVGKLMQLFGESIDAMARAQDLGQDPFSALDAEVGWDALLGKRDEIAGFGELATSDPLSLAAERYVYMRKFAPAFLETFQFNATDAGDDLQAAVALLRDQNRTGKRKLPDDPPMPFAAKHWPSLILQDGQPKRRVYETAVVSTLRERLRAGDVWVDGSREYRRFDSYLMPRNTAESATGLVLRRHVAGFYSAVDTGEQVTSFGQTLGVSNGQILPAAIRVMDQSALLNGPSIMQGLFQRIQDKVCLSGPRDPPSHDAISECVDDEG